LSSISVINSTPILHGPAARAAAVEAIFRECGTYTPRPSKSPARPDVVAKMRLSFEPRASLVAPRRDVAARRHPVTLN
jgi:hypothetical protein